MYTEYDSAVEDIWEFISFQEAIKNNSYEGPPKFPNLPVSNSMQYRDPFAHCFYGLQ